MKEIMLSVEQISKQYRLGVVGTGTISHDINRWWHLVRGKEDPYLKIGEANDRSTKGNSQYVWALKDINFEVDKGDVLGIIGKNGAGKSTLLKILSKVTTPTSGKIKTKGRIASLLEEGTGFHGEMTGRENIYLNGAILGMTKKEIKGKIDEIIDFSGCERYIDTPVKRYSSGMTVRLAFAVAAFLEPEILVIDEVLAVGDVEFQKKAIGKMQDISRGEGRTVLFVSHNMSAIKKLCTRGIVLEKGSVAFEGDADEAVSFYLSNQNSIGSKVVLADRKDRIGNGQFRFKTITFFNSKNEQVNEIMSGEEITIHFEITKYIVIDYAKLIVSIAFQDINMNTVALLSSDELKSDFSNLTTSNSFSLKIPQFLLRGGKYSIRIVSTYKTTHVENFIDTISEAVEIDVLQNDIWNVGKVNRAMPQVLIPAHYES